MSFAENLQYLRKEKNITQEQLAEQLEVSRQSVSKWESGQSYPEMEKLLQICSMFQCNLDTMMQGDISKEFAQDVHGYDAFKNQFSKWIAAGVGLVLFGISAMLFLTGIGVDEMLCTAVFFSFLIVAVLIFIVMGMQNDRFCKKHPQIEDFYSEEEKEHAYKKFVVRVAVSVGVILIGVLLVMVMDERLESQILGSVVQEERMEGLIYGTFMLIITAAVSLLVYGGLQKAKYDIEEYNKDTNPSPEKKRRDLLVSKICGCIMLVATIVFFGWGFCTNAWRITWIVYAVAGILCAIVCIVLSRDDS
ncbi:MAG: helix-turn-helix domain-containing protein [Lachnospiraceae bacterium]|nr:helix-turn-helix domain-containing protein [Lachnospiraceae bacterium]MDE7286995.1 helix-turn-helix domain-containing protein [Lachnospiraceae bacterium]